jgi:hypothetical protein
MVAIAAISLVVLMSLAILGPKIVALRQGRLTACTHNLGTISTALELYSTDWGGKYPGSLSQLTPNYLRTLPKCPSADLGGYVARFGLNAPFNTAPEGQKSDYYYVECAGENHKSVGITGNFPAYGGVQGLIERVP